MIASQHMKKPPVGTFDYGRGVRHWIQDGMDPYFFALPIRLIVQDLLDMLDQALRQGTVQYVHYVSPVDPRSYLTFLTPMWQRQADAAEIDARAVGRLPINQRRRGYLIKDRT